MFSYYIYFLSNFDYIFLPYIFMFFRHDIIIANMEFLLFTANMCFVIINKS